MNLITFTVIDNDKMFVEYYVEKQKNYTEQTKSQQPTIKKPSKNGIGRIYRYVA